MKALSTLKSAIDQSSFVGIIALVLLVPVIRPDIASAAALQTSEQSTAQVFEINVSDPSLLDSAPKQNNTETSVTVNDVEQSDPLAVNLTAYLKENNSPLQNYVPQLLTHDNWDKVVAISFVESNMCIHNLNYNCSGIGGPGHFRKYKDFGGWIDDMSSLLNSHYNGWTLDKMNCVYVQPCSPNWAYGSNRTLAQLQLIETVSEQQRRELAQNNNSELATLPTFPETTN
jgi:hypothetical protein